MAIHRFRHCLIATLTFGVAAGLSPHASAQDVAWARVFPSGAGATWTPASSEQYTSSGTPITVTRLGAMNYQFEVRLPGLAPDSGIALASAYGGNHTAVVNGWYQSGSDVLVFVDVYTPSGNPAADAPFTVYFRRGGDNADRQSYLWANEPTNPSYTPSFVFAWNGNRGAPTAQRFSTGVYEIRLPGLAAAGAERGHVQVSPFGPMMHRAKVAGWLNDGSDMLVEVRCFDAAGSPADARFVLSYNETAAPIAGEAGSGGHVWADRPTTRAYVPSPSYTDSNGTRGPADAETVRRLGTGHYRVALPDLQPQQGTAQVSAYGTGSEYAAIGNWTSDGCVGTRVEVLTFDAAGNPADARFTLQYLAEQPAVSQEVAWAWVNPAGQGSSFTPDASYQFSTQGGTITVARASPAQHKFIVRVPNMTNATGVVHATAYGGNHSAVVNSWWLTSGVLHASIELFDPSGNPANDGAFTFRYRRGGNNADREAYLWANLPSTTSYTPNTTYSWNADRAAPTITKLGPGQYAAYLPGLSNYGTSTDRGHVQVTPYGNQPLRAQIDYWSHGTTGNVIAVVRCFDPAGNYTNGMFTLSYHEHSAPIGDHVGSGAQVFADDPTAASYAPHPLFVDSNGTYGPTNAEIVQRMGTGHYRVHLPNVAASASATVLATAFGSAAEYATIGGWFPAATTGTLVTVRTWSPTGAPVDSKFTIDYLTNRPAIGDSSPAINQNYGAGCHGPQLAAQTRPILCQPWLLSLSGVPAGAVLGFLQLDIVQANLPLAPAAPGCTQLTGGAVTLLLGLPVPDPAYVLQIPASGSFIGLPIHAQGGAFVPGINPFWLTASNGVRGVVGDR